MMKYYKKNKRTNHDVLISHTKTGIRITLRNSVLEEFDRITFAATENKLYFIYSPSGYIFRYSPNSVTNRYTALKSQYAFYFFRNFEGEFDLKYDIELDMYYIER